MSDKLRFNIVKAAIIFALLILSIFAFFLFMGLLPYLFIGIGFSVNKGHNETVTDLGSFYRITAEYLVDDAEPLSFDIVVACKYDGFDTQTRRGGITPVIFGKRTRNSHAVFMSLPDFCGDVSSRTLGKLGGISDGAFLPFTIWFDDSDNLNFGLGYASIFAFNNPASRLSFLNASVRYASREEFEDWYVSSNGNLASEIVKQASDPSVASPSEMKAHEPGFPDRCYGIGFVRGNDEVRAIIRTYWPEGRPKYWSNEQIGTSRWDELRKDLLTSEKARFSMFNFKPEPFKQVVHNSEWSSSTLGKGYSSLNESKLSSYLKFQVKPTEQYPVLYFRKSSDPVSTPTGSRVYAEGKIQPETKGFVGCYSSSLLSRPNDIDIGPVGVTLSEPSQNNHASKLYFSVNGKDAFSIRRDRKRYVEYLIIDDHSIGKFIEFSITGNGNIF